MHTHPEYTATTEADVLDFKGNLRAASLAPAGDQQPLLPQMVLAHWAPLRQQCAEIAEERGQQLQAAASAAKQLPRARVACAASTA